MLANDASAAGRHRADGKWPSGNSKSSSVISSVQKGIQTTVPIRFNHCPAKGAEGPTSGPREVYAWIAAVAEALRPVAMKIHAMAFPRRLDAMSTPTPVYTT